MIELQLFYKKVLRSCSLNSLTHSPVFTRSDSHSFVGMYLIMDIVKGEEGWEREEEVRKKEI